MIYFLLSGIAKIIAARLKITHVAIFIGLLCINTSAAFIPAIIA